MKSSDDFFVIYAFYRDGPIASCVRVCVCVWGGGPIEVHISIPYGNLIQGVCVWGLIINFYRGGSSNY